MVMTAGRPGSADLSFLAGRVNEYTVRRVLFPWG